ncbi:TPR repeat-containing protein [Burkholderiales bacterium GJ-E10]|nr:TPR repeat-containing protein [Burkholderiales bacterium GJ-E10]
MSGSDPRAREAFQRGLALAETLDWENATAAFEQAAIGDPGNATYWFALGNSRFTLRRHGDSIKAYLAGLQRKPNFAPAHIQLGNVFKSLGLHEEAWQCFETALALGGDRAKLLSAMAHQAQQACRWDLFAPNYAALREELASGARTAVPFQILTAPSTREEQRSTAQAFWEAHCGTILPLPPPPPRMRDAPIRIGYVTNDIYRHATAYLIAEVLERHDRSRFDVFLYSYGADDGSQIRQRILAAVGTGFRDITRLSDHAAADWIRRDDIDILLDLKGYALDPRPGIFAHRPGRVQVNYLGYPGTLGSRCHDYIIGDPTVTPLHHGASYSEAIAQLPNCYQANDRQRRIGPTPSRADCGLPEGRFVFSSFNSCYKITAEMFERWCRILRQVDGSVLWLYEANAQAKRNLIIAAERFGVASTRLIWAPHLPLEAHLGRMPLSDLMLDTFPVTAHTTASDALWAGLPLVTILGDSFVSRVAASALRAANLPDLVATDLDDYESTVINFAQNPAKARSIRQQLDRGRLTCSLFDSVRYVQDFEALLNLLIDRNDCGLPPEPIGARTHPPSTSL